MSEARIRFYPSDDPERSSVIGFSAHAQPFGQSEVLGTFFAEREYTANPAEIEDSPSWLNLEVRPPMTDEHIQEFGALALNHIADGVIVYDNRRGMPHPLEHNPDAVIARG